MAIVLKEMGLTVVQQPNIDVYFSGRRVGHYEGDLLVNGVVLVELKAARTLHSDHEAQLLCYLKSTRYEVGLLLNFGVKPEIKRKAYDNSEKGSLSWART